MPTQLLWYVNWIFGLIILWRFQKSIETMSGKKGLLAAIESNLSAKEKGMKKDEIRKNATTKRKKKVSKKQKMTITNVFRKILHQLVKPQFQQIKPQSRLRNQIHGLIILHFHIYNLLRNLYQLTKYNTICFLSHLKAFCHV